jgi:hypothetical protein
MPPMAEPIFRQREQRFNSKRHYSPPGLPMAIPCFNLLILSLGMLVYWT